MKALLTLAAALLLQTVSISSNDPIAEPQHFRFARAVILPPGATGQACAVLDASVFAHAASESLNDLRLFTRSPSGAEVEVPFVLTESGPRRDNDEPAFVQNLGSQNGDIIFDLAMPARPYTAVVLDLAAKDFLATAHVTGSSGTGKPATDLGTFTLFDLTTRRLSRSTSLPLQEATFLNLHIELHLTPAPNTPAHNLGPTIVHGASVPPSREAQTLYTAISSISGLQHRGKQSLATIHVPAHIPIERVSFTLDPKFNQNFLRGVKIAATPDDSSDQAAAESITGEISRVSIPQPGSDQAPLENQQLSIDTALAADMRIPATVEISINNGDDTPLPITSITLAMRQRKVCFEAASLRSSSTLFYGDEDLHVPTYDYASLFVDQPNPITATLAAEMKNTSFVPRRDTRTYAERHPELLWVGLLTAIGILGSIALRGSRRQSGQDHTPR
jgi:hypothetical protein